MKPLLVHVEHLSPKPASPKNASMGDVSETCDSKRSASGAAHVGRFVSRSLLVAGKQWPRDVLHDRPEDRPKSRGRQDAGHVPGVGVGSNLRSVFAQHDASVLQGRDHAGSVQVEPWVGCSLEAVGHGLHDCSASWKVHAVRAVSSIHADQHI